MQRFAICLAAAIPLAWISAAPASAQNLNPEFANAPLTLEQEQVITHVRNTDRHLYLNARRPIRKYIKDWTQADYQTFKWHYERIRLARLQLLRGGSGQAKLPEDIAATETAIFFQLQELATGGGGDDGNGDGGGEGDD